MFSLAHIFNVFFFSHSLLLYRMWMFPPSLWFNFINGKIMRYKTITMKIIARWHISYDNYSSFICLIIKIVAIVPVGVWCSAVAHVFDVMEIDFEMHFTMFCYGASMQKRNILCKYDLYDAMRWNFQKWQIVNE